MAAERLIGKGQFKDAVKEAKLCYRKTSTEENHHLLEQAYFLRAQQLYQGRMQASAQEVAQHLLEFGVTDPALIEPAAHLLQALGMSRAALGLHDRLDSPEAKARLLTGAADQAVLHPEHARAISPELRQGALQVRAALDALEAGDQESALNVLRDIARGSPFSDWKLFVRGLAANYRHEAEETKGNWDRLDPQRVAAKIARGVQALNRSAPLDSAKPDGEPDLSALETVVFGEPILGTLRQLGEFINQEKWTQAVRLLGPLRSRLNSVDPALSERLTRVLYASLIQAAQSLDFKEAHTLVGTFIRLAEPLAIDPRWNRLWALIWEGPQAGPNGAKEFWRIYLDDLKTLPVLTAERRVLAQVLVCMHLARQYLEDAKAFEDLPFGRHTGKKVDEELKELRDQAVAWLEQALKLDPRQLEPYLALQDAYRDWDQPDQVVETDQRLVLACPENFETLVFLARYHTRRDEPALALEYAQRARRLRPLDDLVKSLESSAHISLARHHALKKRWAEGRAEFASAEELEPEQSRDPRCLARKAVFELKAGQTEPAEAWIREAEALLVEPTLLWFALLIEAIRYKLPKPHRDRFAGLFQDALKKKARGETAGALAELANAYQVGQVEYSGRKTHLKQVVDYLRRTTRIKYLRPDLIHVCGLLKELPKERALLETLTKRGLKLFPGVPYFLWINAILELDKGLYQGKVDLAGKQLRKALTLAEASSEPLDLALVPKIKEGLALYDDLTSNPLGMGFPFFGGDPKSSGAATFFRMMEDMYNELDGDFDDDFDDDPDFDPEFDESPRPKPPARRGRKQK
ncbi:MAG: hypothetical protein ABI353_19760 [Isosphaeraceae bacterium]